MKMTTIQIEKSLLEEMKSLKMSPRQTYAELISHMIQIFKDLKNRNQYNEFLHKIQLQKMQELWDNKEDEDWENA